MIDLIAKPLMSGLPAAAAPGVRIVVASDGLWREISLPWLYCMHSIAALDNKDVKLPFGALETRFELRCGAVPASLLQEFRRMAAQAAPNEVAAALVWNDVTGQWRLAPRPSLFASAARVIYLEAKLGENEHLVVDIHSHADTPAFFSAADNADDRYGMKIAMVLGNVRGDITSAARLCLLGAIWPVAIDGNGVMEVQS